MNYHGDFYGTTAPEHLWASSELIVSFLKIKDGEDVQLKIKRTYVYCRAEECLELSLFVQKKERMQNTKVRHVLMEIMVIIIEIYCC